VKKANTTFTEAVSFDKGKAESVETAYGWWYEVWMNMDTNPWEFALIRKSV
jgi:hypothetical protein